MQWNDCKSNKYFYAWQKELYQLLISAWFVSTDLMLLLRKMILVKILSRNMFTLGKNTVLPVTSCPYDKLTNTIWQHDRVASLSCDELTVWRVDCVMSWSCDQLTGLRWWHRWNRSNSVTVNSYNTCMDCEIYESKCKFCTSAAFYGRFNSCPVCIGPVCAIMF